MSKNLRLKDKYLNEVVPALMSKYGYKSIMEVPKLEKVVINMGVGDATTNSKLLDAAMKDLEKITGQTPVVTKAKNQLQDLKLEKDKKLDVKPHLEAITCITLLIN